jgi:hypothetical protein
VGAGSAGFVPIPSATAIVNINVGPIENVE